jgi:hypothetical protein
MVSSPSKLGGWLGLTCACSFCIPCCRCSEKTTFLREARYPIVSFSLKVWYCWFLISTLMPVWKSQNFWIQIVVLLYSGPEGLEPWYIRVECGMVELFISVLYLLLYCSLKLSLTVLVWNGSKVLTCIQKVPHLNLW